MVGELRRIEFFEIFQLVFLGAPIAECQKIIGVRFRMDLAWPWQESTRIIRSNEENDSQIVRVLQIRMTLDEKVGHQ